MAENVRPMAPNTGETPSCVFCAATSVVVQTSELCVAVVCSTEGSVEHPLRDITAMQVAAVAREFLP